jgi:hypothetical protein
MVNSKLKIILEDVKPKPLEKIPSASLNDLANVSITNIPKGKLLVDTDLNFFQWLIAKSFQIKFEGEIKMWNTIKKFLVAKIVQWILKVGSGVLLTLGVSQNSVEEIVGGVVSLLIGILYSLFTHKKVALTNPTEFLKIE